MAATLEAIRGGGGSIKVGTIGTISSLMTREIESSSSKSSSRTPGPAGCGNGPLKPQRKTSEASSSSSTTPGIKHRSSEPPRKTKGQNLITATTPKRPKQQSPLEEVGNNSTVIQGNNKRSPVVSGKAWSHKRSYHIPMLGSENISLEKTPLRNKPMRKGYTLVDIVDVNCGNSGGSLSNRLKKLSFSKLSHSFM